MKEFSQGIGRQEGSVLEKLFMVLLHNLDDMHKVNKRFIQELQHYSRIVDFMHEAQKRKAAFTHVFYETGVKEGLFLDGINYDIVVALHEYLQGFIDFVLYRDFDFAEVMKTIIYIHLRGISTEKGKRMLEEFYNRLKSEK
ncbi:MAG: hypothetical protein Q4E55_03755 [Bacteroidales bacterium]|nr:hypothetical protein [Bacteroidales bacterium]